MCCALIASLLSAGSPTAIAGEVSEVVVDALYGASLRGVAHVSDEDAEVLPLVTDGNPAASIVLPCSRVWVGTTLDHAVPSIIGPTALPVFSIVPVDKSLLLKNLTLVTSTRFAVVGYQAGLKNFGDGTALTTATPPVTTVARGISPHAYIFDHGPAIEGTAEDVMTSLESETLVHRSSLFGCVLELPVTRGTLETVAFPLLEGCRELHPHLAAVRALDLGSVLVFSPILISSHDGGTLSC